MTRMLKAGLLASTVMVLGVVSTSVNAASISTGVAGVNWKFVEFRAGANASTGALRTATETAATNDDLAAKIGNGHASWVKPNNVAFTPEAGFQWISALSSGASEGIFGFYTFELTLTPPAVTAGYPYMISGKLSSDNLLDSFTINGVEQLSGYVTNSEFSYRVVSPLPSGTGVAPLVIRATVFNMANTVEIGTFGNTPTANTPAGATSGNAVGLLLQGSAVVVPLPPAAFGGLGLMGAMAVCSLVRRARA